MTFLVIAEVIVVIVAYVFLLGLFCLLVLTVVINWRGTPSLLDGRPLGSVLDDSDRRHLVAAQTARDQPLALFAAELDEILALPTVEHP